MSPRDIAVQLPGLLLVHHKIRAHRVERHEHFEHEIFVPLQGEIQLELESKQLKAGPGKMVYLPPKTAHYFRSDNESPGERLIVIVDPLLWRRYRGCKAEPRVLPASQLCKEILFQLLLHPHTKAARALSETLVQTLSEMLSEVAEVTEGSAFHLQGRAKDARVRKALERIAADFSAPLATTRLAREAGLSVRSLNRLFMAELGLSPKQVISLHRVEEAKRLLKKGRLTVTDVSLEVGYPSLSQFISTFRKLTGRLPSECRSI